MKQDVFDIVIIGGGPAGCASAVYAGRKQMRGLLITKDFGGQSQVSASIENWIGEISISGLELAKKFEAHVKAQETIDVKQDETVLRIAKAKKGCLLSGRKIACYDVQTDKQTYTAKTIIIASGARRRTLGVEGEKEFNGKGVAYCSTCDAPIFRSKDVAVIGGGNAGVEAVIDLAVYANHIYLMERSDSLKADASNIAQMQERAKGKLTILLNTQVTRLSGESFLSGISYKDLAQNEKELSLSVQGVFVEIGSIPNSEIVSELIALTPRGEIPVNHANQETSVPGIFAAGDVTDEIYKQNNISAGQGVAAALSAYQYLLNRQKLSPAQEGDI